MLNECAGKKTMPGCDEYANGIKRVAGWAFCHLFHYYFGDGSVVLKSETADGKNIRFFVTEKWLEVNHAGRFGFTKNLMGEFLEHIDQCSSTKCKEAKKRLGKINPFWVEGKLPGSGSIALTSACEGRQFSNTVTLSRERGFDETIDEIMPFINWFIEEPDFWVWPDKERPGLV